MSMTRKLLLTGICAALILFISDYAFAASVDVKSINVAPTNVTLRVGEEKTLRTSVTPKDASDKTITWSSSDDDIVTVDSQGKITAIKSGRARITAESHNGKTSSCFVTVPGSEVEVKKIEFLEDSVAIRVNQERALFIDVSPYEAYQKDYELKSSNTDIVIVGIDDTIIGISPGTAEITAIADNGKTAVCKVTVRDTVVTGLDQPLQNKDIFPVIFSGGEVLNVAALRQDVEDGAKARENKDSKEITLTYTEKTRVSTAALRSGAFAAAYNSKEAILHFRTLDENGKIQGQMTIRPKDTSADDMDILLGVYTAEAQTGNVKSHASGYFGADVAVVHLPQQGEFKMDVRVAAKADLQGLDTGAIKIYRYYGGAYTLYKNQGYHIDSNGYIHFMVSDGGTYILV